MEELAQVSPERHGMTIQVVTAGKLLAAAVVPPQVRPATLESNPAAAPSATGRTRRPGPTDTAKFPPPSVIILGPDVREFVDANLPAAYNQQMIYGLRPEVFLRVYVREDLWEAFLAEVSRQWAAGSRQ